ncbi:MAG TPA: hypothetical protein VF432_28790 [Thermoanaerobaculia bacterium]
MASKKGTSDSTSGTGGGSGRVMQRRPGRNRQVRRAKEVAAVATSVTRARPDKAQSIARAVPRQSRGTKQQRTVGTTDLTAARPISKITVARRLQTRQIATSKISEVQVALGLRAPVVKIDTRRRAQVSQRAATRVVAKGSTTK